MGNKQKNKIKKERIEAGKIVKTFFIVLNHSKKENKQNKKSEAGQIVQF